MKIFMILSLQLLLIVFSGTTLAEGDGKDAVPAASDSAPADTPNPADCIDREKPLNTIIKCSCFIEGKKDGVLDSWIEEVEGEGEGILAAINNAVEDCDNSKAGNIIIKKTKLAHCSDFHTSQED